MAKMQFDALDASLLVMGIASAFMLVGIATFNLFDVDFAATVFARRLFSRLTTPHFLRRTARG